MNRYRLALAAAAAVIAAAVILTIVRQPTPATRSSGGNGALFPASERIAAPEFIGLDGWVNSPPLSIAGLHGHVVLIDFWTFSCVNCVRTLPHLQELYSAYRGYGFVLVGVHSPEFDFEKNRENVAAAVRRLEVTWPVALDSSMATWGAYNNRYWPAEYLIDQNGRVAYVHFGEGDYDVTDGAVARLLGVHAPAGAAPTPSPAPMTPELYAGSQRGQLADGAGYGGIGRPVAYADHGPPRTADLIQVTGTWIDQGQYLQAARPGHVRLRFQASDVYVVAGTSAGPLAVTVQLDGSAPPAPLYGPDLAAAGFSVTRQDLYHLVAHESAGYHLIDLAVPAGFQLYTFTFG